MPVRGQPENVSRSDHSGKKPGVESPSGAGQVAEVILRSVGPAVGLTIHRVSLNEGMIPVRIVESKTPAAYRLSQNHPNPFNPETTIQYELPEVGVVRLSVYALTGQLVRTLMDGERTAGTHSATWDGRDDTGQAVASGVYLCRMIAGEYRAVRKLLLVR